MPKFVTLWRVPASLVLATVVLTTGQTLSAHEFTPVPTSRWSFDSLLQLPILSWLSPGVPAPISFEAPAPLPPPCLVLPLSEVTDPEALEFEAAVGSTGVVRIDGLTPDTAVALNRFEHLVFVVGGRIELKSAYRPATYQAHLQELWDKWMLELRNNSEPACAQLRAEVGDEFARHDLLETQRPVSSSDHTRGLSFDAAVLLPSRARFGRRKVGIDSLARLAGVRRPAIAVDPVHFRIM